MRIAESLLDVNGQGNAPTAAADEDTSGSPPQAPLVAMSVAPELSCSMGSGSVPVTPYCISAGPEARIRTVFEVEPPMTKPAMRTLPPVPTWTRAEMLTILGLDGV